MPLGIIIVIFFTSCCNCCFKKFWRNLNANAFLGLLCDLLWSDPDKDITGWSENDRGVSFTFGSDIVSRFLEKHDLDLICRAHQVVEDGYEFFNERRLVTVFSAPNYCGEFDNKGAIMTGGLFESFLFFSLYIRLFTLSMQKSSH